MNAWSLRTGRDRIYQDRHEAGRVLAEQLVSYRDRPDVLVLGLARGGVPIAAEVASHLHAPLDVFVVRKLGVPQWQELAMGAVASGGGLVLNDALVNRLGIDDHTLTETIRRETAEIERREQAYRAGRAAPELAGKTVILVDDGIATGATMLAAVRAVRAAERVVVAVPVGPATLSSQLQDEADEVVCTSTPAAFEAVGQAFVDFHQVSDEEVRRLLAESTADPGQA
ncbi:phosphoribosyl transferase [Mycolicibacterium conceptionense]|jgi:putative phosphoribosyl transferase|uniref:Phosphoribosyl transferase n=2 Tax=Mycolicibacterium TaxID=1866885 RepID=A0ABR5FNH9_9MYCO|nr:MULTISPECIES: phosphoribosyltransferase family protein [Mycolicibacterium]KLI08702.1 phosphoribosyl transferase [Mycolicibacterium senegalense]KLO48394.1 phosphoribosyl transferase [Mycolicibacterium senegalense]KMV20432.1 phosphoribosyl transferase [Mycolicibacterium conceptionense]OBJ93842.1 phosphoribosyl transferase [Mycolicibacterium conceptionense]OMB80540.1 phosphoribosyl transferase [Mycolicibacterium conceptionense]